jgi:hypothetical protein
MRDPKAQTHMLICAKRLMSPKSSTIPSSAIQDDLPPAPVKVTSIAYRCPVQNVGIDHHDSECDGLNQIQDDA